MQISVLSFSFPTDAQKVSFIIGLLKGKALRWDEAFYNKSSVAETSLEEFLELFELTFSPVKNEKNSSRDETETLDKLITLAIGLDNRLREESSKKHVFKL